MACIIISDKESIHRMDWEVTHPFRVRLMKNGRTKGEVHECKNRKETRRVIERLFKTKLKDYRRIQKREKSLRV